MFCGCGRFRFVVRVICGTAVIIKSAFNVLTAVALNNVDEVSSLTSKIKFYAASYTVNYFYLFPVLRNMQHENPAPM